MFMEMKIHFRKPELTKKHQFLQIHVVFRENESMFDIARALRKLVCEITGFDLLSSKVKGVNGLQVTVWKTEKKFWGRLVVRN